MNVGTATTINPDRLVTLAELEARLAAAEAEPKPRRRRWRWIKWALLVIAGFAAWLAITTPLGRALEPLPAPAMLLMSADGVAIARRGSVKEAPVEVSRLPKHVSLAFVSIEDRRFYSHLGIDPKGIARAAWVNLRAGEVREGGSTITQQLAKTAFLTADQNMVRKMREVLIAGWLEAWLTKDEILGRYMSSIYFGDGVYGLRAASRHYFGREPEDMSVSQAAMLAGIVKAPSRLAPTNDLKRARARAELVEAAMVREGAITARQARLARPASVLGRRGEVPTGTFFADWVWPQARGVAEAEYGEVAVETTLDARLQKLAVRAVNNARLGGAQAALVAMRPDGRVVAMVGGRSYKTSRFNRATQAKRQSGSAFKLFVYLAAIRSGMEPDDVVRDAPVTVDGWAPKNNDGRYLGPISLADAFARSSNVAAVRLQERVGRPAVIKAARDLGLRGPLTEQPSLALGTSATTLLDMTAAYASVASGRYPVRPRGVAKAGDTRAWYELGALSELSMGGRSLRRSETAAMRAMLGDAIDRGTGRAARLSLGGLPIPAYGKTGTTSNNKDALFIGFAGDLVVGVWVGNDDNSAMKGVTGGGTPARIWREFMGGALRSGRMDALAGRSADDEARVRVAYPAGEPDPRGQPRRVGGTAVLPSEITEIVEAGEEIGDAVEQLGGDAADLDDIATIARGTRRVAETINGEPVDVPPDAEPPPEE